MSSLVSSTPHNLIESNYVPDSINLSEDREAAEYWFDCFQELAEKFSKQAASSSPEESSAESRSKSFLLDYRNRLDEFKLKKGPSLSIRELLELNETLLRLHGFQDPWFKQKQIENTAAVERFQNRIEEIDLIEDAKSRWTELVRGVLAGNIFDWGAQIVAEILQNDDNFGLNDALSKIQERPWLIDDLDLWLDRIQSSSHNCALIFVDNSGVDIVLGILPFARELLKRNTKVILAANSEPCLNDVTFSELKEIVEQCKLKCDIFKKALEDSKLLIVSNGQKGPCLDMRKLPKELHDVISANGTDLLILEGMGRALHTNLYAKFNCETLKLAVIKNEWLANRLGGGTFSVVCKYEK